MPLFRVPSATYRIQFHLGFRFADARELIPYLHELGISDLYASPGFKARRGSSHGYDVADPLLINSELGTEKEFDEMIERLKVYDMGLLLDIVPNHMSASSDNPWWMDVLENGESSPYAHYFDVYWNSPGAETGSSPANRILLPVLAKPYGQMLEDQELSLKLNESGFFIRCGDSKLPLDPATFGPIVERVLNELAPDSESARDQLSLLLNHIRRLPPRTVRAPKKLARRRRQKEVIKNKLGRLLGAQAEVRSAIERAMLAFNGAKGVPESFNLLDCLLNEQAYRLACWEVASEQIGYRRFFDVTDLVGLRVELPDVFQARHAAALELITEGKITGLRVDHIDGLCDPLSYLDKMQHSIGHAAQSDDGSERFFMVVEKILADHEDLPAAWPVCGTTGYDFTNLANQALIDPNGLADIRRFYESFTGRHQSFAEVARDARLCVLEQLLGADINSLAAELARLAAKDRYARGVTRSEHKAALSELSACLPVYRTYIRGCEVPENDRKQIAAAVEDARRRSTQRNVTAALDFLERVLLLKPSNSETRRAWLAFVMRWQQFTGAAMAKGVEDTALYRYAALLSLNDVGGNPGAKGKTTTEVHEELLARGKRTPLTLNATSTHDTKRSEDVRARISVISEFPKEWKRRVARWSRLNRPKIRDIGGCPAPDRNEEMFFYQTLLGAWPLSAEEDFSERLKQYALKALREAKVHTSWRYPNSAYEDAVIQFVGDLISLPAEDAFRQDFLAFQSKIAFYGALNSLSQVLVKVMAPGIPDFYQGAELWDFSFVDPDNRRPVDFSARIRALEELRRQETQGRLELVARLTAGWRDGWIKLYVTYKALECRKKLAQLFAQGDYVPLAAAGSRRDHVLSFARGNGRDRVLVSVPRLTGGITRPGVAPLGVKAWGRSSIELPKSSASEWRNIFTGEILAVGRRGSRRLALAQIFASFPVCVLVAQD
ncbi:MAG: malto-oligosyltrehalose synthase [Terriglobia bacterium]